MRQEVKPTPEQIEKAKEIPPWIYITAPYLGNYFFLIDGFNVFDNGDHSMIRLRVLKKHDRYKYSGDYDFIISVNDGQTHFNSRHMGEIYITNDRGYYQFKVRSHDTIHPIFIHEISERRIDHIIVYVTLENIARTAVATNSLRLTKPLRILKESDAYCNDERDQEPIIQKILDRFEYPEAIQRRIPICIPSNILLENDLGMYDYLIDSYASIIKMLKVKKRKK